MSTAAQDKAKAIINGNAIALFSKSYCPYCSASKDTLTKAGARFFVIELDQVDDGAEIQAALKKMSGQGTVPNIYVNQQHLGGNSDLQAKYAQSPDFLKTAGAV